MPHFHAGRGSIIKLSEVLKSLKTRRLFIVTGKKSFADCGAQAAIKPLLKGKEVTYFNDLSPNPTIEEAHSAVAICESSNADTIIAIGGGSVIDLAKTVSAFHQQGLEAMAIATGMKMVDTETTLPLVAVPTTAGTGSEATHFAVIYIDGKKFSIASPSLLPAASILDANFTDGLPGYITACTGFDALCQAIESLWARGATEESRGYARRAIPQILEHLPKAIHNSSQASRDAMLASANLAGRAINISKTTAPHALSYSITSDWNVPHGHAVALTLGSFIAYHGSNEEFREIQLMLSAESPTAAANNWYNFMKKCGLSLRPNELDFNQIAHSLARKVNLERLENHPIPLTQEQLESIIRNIPPDLS